MLKLVKIQQTKIRCKICSIEYRRNINVFKSNKPLANKNHALLVPTCSSQLTISASCSFVNSTVCYCVVHFSKIN